MARPLRIEFKRAVYHITSRGNTGTAIFFDDEDRLRLLDVLRKAVERFDWICHTYCLMSNHYHLLVETPRANLSRGMRHLNDIYTQSFNKRHKRYLSMYCKGDSRQSLGGVVSPASGSTPLPKLLHPPSREGEPSP